MTSAHIPTIYPSVLDIPASCEAVLLDAYGVFWSGNATGLIPGAKNVMQQLISSNKIVGILSNSTQLAAKEIEKLQKHGLFQNQHYHFLVTSGEAAKEIFSSASVPFKTPKNTFYLFGDQHPNAQTSLKLFEDSPYSVTQDPALADFIYVPVPQINGIDQTDPKAFLDLVKDLVKTKLPMVCANPDFFAHEGAPPRLVVRQGSIAKLYEELGGEVFYIGKPHAYVYQVAMRHFKKLGIDSNKNILMVGDTPETDIKGAKQFGMLSCLTTQTGIMKERIEHGTIKELSSILSLDHQPDYYIEKL